MDLFKCKSFRRRDSIFYKLFGQAPTLLFDLLATTPANAANYRFDSVAVKEPKFEIDGVFLPPESDGAGSVYFYEVQFQKDEQLYERLFGESFLYFYRNRSRYSDWQAVVIYPSRSIEQSDVYPYRAVLNSNQVHRVCLDELGDIRALPLGIALMVLTTVEETQAPEEARYLLSRVQQEVASEANRDIREILANIMSYKFTQLSRAEVESMLGITLQETRFYQEAKAEERQEGRQEGRQEEACALIVRQWTRRLQQEVSEEIRSRLANLPLPVLEDLSEALLDFATGEDLLAWLEARQSEIQ
ncbi:Rpn family recombination-promoting nuclease/putative transposase [Microcoleus sp. FACHB-DQ6]|nr:Rpn family recombination-promoting nuclease/putative transposase [Microcoleus sp. FACHB-DQ6]